MKRFKWCAPHSCPYLMFPPPSLRKTGFSNTTNLNRKCVEYAKGKFERVCPVLGHLAARRVTLLLLGRMTGHIKRERNSKGQASLDRLHSAQKPPSRVGRVLPRPTRPGLWQYHHLLWRRVGELITRKGRLNVPHRVTSLL